ncbi:hypothetical protein SAMN05660662_0980 [Blastococcus aurantiacus]|uniref:Uncharacterized protein n=1 Tax=Blastococcus aurantiacus TaxID=1550231 RepID=A0A1G7I3K4_9ACTN|nr:hypothetical protein [Blastococcus aurantiacus]SDF07183.1 hypothetical protein SAMN05660662_0980 [Blastococcus aurantiacus]
MSEPLHLPSAGPEPIPADAAVAAVLGYAAARRPLYYRAPNVRTGRWAEVPAFGYERFDRRPVPDAPLGEADILTAEGLHGRLGREEWTAMAAALPAVQSLADDVVAQAAGRAFWELPEDEFSVLAEPGTVGALLREIGELCASAGASRWHVAAALHHRHPELFPLLHTTTRWALLPHSREGDSGVAAVVHRELLNSADAFAELEAAVRAEGVGLTRLRLHDVLLWLSATLRFQHAVAAGRAPVLTERRTGRA